MPASISPATTCDHQYPDLKLSPGVVQKCRKCGAEIMSDSANGGAGGTVRATAPQPFQQKRSHGG